MIRRMRSAFIRRASLGTSALAGPGTLWLVLFFLIPTLILAAYSVMPRGVYGGVNPGFTLEHYARLFDPLYLSIAARTAAYSALCTVVCLIVGFPMAWVIARSGRFKPVLLFLTVLPLWTSFLVRTYALIFLLRDTGLVNSVLRALDLTREPIAMLYTPGAVMLGLVYGFLPMMILPVFTSLEKLDLNLLEAAAMLGAKPSARLRRVIVPLAMPGVAAGCLLVFIPCLGAFLTPDLLGGARQVMLGNLVQNQFGAARNWPFGSAISVALMTVVLVAVLAWLRRRPEAP